MEELNPWLLPFTVWRLPFTGRKSAVPRESLHTRTGPPGRWKRRGGSQSAPRRASSSPAPTTGAGAERGVSRLRPCLARAPSRPRSHADQRRRPARKGAGPRVSLPRLSCTGALRPPVHSTCFWPAWPRGPQRGRWAGFYLTKLNSSTCSWIPHYLNRGGDIRGKEKKSSVHLLSCVWLFATPWPAARQASLSITNSWSLLKLMSIESVMPSNRLILCRTLLLPSIFPSIRVFSDESVLHTRWPNYWNFSFNISPSNEYSGLVSFRMDLFDLLAVWGTLKSLLQHHSSKASVLWCSTFFIV